MDTDLLERLAGNPALEKGLHELAENCKEKIVFSTSFGMEDQVITHAVFAQQLKNIEIFTLDTGRLFPETYAVWDRTEMRYNHKIKSYYPAAGDLENFINTNGINPFYASTDLRKTCCSIRKVAPLERALKGAAIWITGLRAEQSENRNDLKVIEWNAQFQLYKYNPLLHWTSRDIAAYIKKNNVPYNLLHDQGFVSIGCAPCTRAIGEGEDQRAGRWWWENNSKKECGLHTKQTKQK